MLVQRLAQPFGAEIFDLRADHLRDLAVKQELRAALFESLLLVIRNQTPDFASQVALTRVFGDAELVWDTSRRHPESPLVQVISSAPRPSDADRSGSQFWHTDGSFLECPPIATLLAIVRVPQTGGDTLFTDTRAAYDSLPSSLLLRVRGLKLKYSYHYRLHALHTEHYGRGDSAEKAKHPDVLHPLVRKHPVTERGSLYLDELCVAGVEGEPDEIGRPLLAELYSYALAPERCYRHEWRSDDLLIWDNASMMHRRGEEHRGNRVLHRTTVAGPLPVPYEDEQ